MKRVTSVISTKELSKTTECIKYQEGYLEEGVSVAISNGFTGA